MNTIILLTEYYSTKKTRNLLGIHKDELNENTQFPMEY